MCGLFRFGGAVLCCTSYECRQPNVFCLGLARRTRVACISLRLWRVYVGDLVSLGCVVRSVVWELVQIAKPVTKFEVRQRKWQRRGLS